jgi:hypothetical protein
MKGLYRAVSDVFSYYKMCIVRQRLSVPCAFLRQNEHTSPLPRGLPMAKPNYSFAKRQRDLAKEQKKEEKLQRKQQAAQDEAAVDGEPVEGGETAVDHATVESEEKPESPAS